MLPSLDMVILSMILSLWTILLLIFINFNVKSFLLWQLCWWWISILMSNWILFWWILLFLFRSADLSKITLYGLMFLLARALIVGRLLSEWIKFIVYNHLFLFYHSVFWAFWDLELSPTFLNSLLLFFTLNILNYRFSIGQNARILVL
jgi:hypothetical protein